MGGKYGILTCAICGTQEPQTAPNQLYCQACRRNEPARRKYKEAQEAAALAEQAEKAMRRLSIVQVDRLAKELHTSYGKLVAGYSEKEIRRALGAGTPKAR